MIDGVTGDPASARSSGAPSARTPPASSSSRAEPGRADRPAGSGAGRGGAPGRRPHAGTSGCSTRVERLDRLGGSALQHFAQELAEIPRPYDASTTTSVGLAST